AAPDAESGDGKEGGRDGVKRGRKPAPVPQGELELLRAGDGSPTGTLVRFRPDDKIFETVQVSYDTLAGRLRELAFLNNGVAITLTDERNGKSQRFEYKGGIVEFVKYLNTAKNPLHGKPVFFARSKDTTQVEIALQYNDSYAENVFSFV